MSHVLPISSMTACPCLDTFCYEAPVLLLDDSKFRVWSLEFRVDMKLHQSEVRQRFLHVGFSSCTAPTFCCGLGILDIDSEFGSEVWS